MSPYRLTVDTGGTYTWWIQTWNNAGDGPWSNGLTFSISTTTVTATPDPATRGQSVTAAWEGIVSPTVKDWVGVYAWGSTDSVMVDWVYVSCSQTAGNQPLASGRCQIRIPSMVAPGTYELRLFKDNGYNRLASSTFSVQ